MLNYKLTPNIFPTLSPRERLTFYLNNEVKLSQYVLIYTIIRVVKRFSRVHPTDPSSACKPTGGTEK